MLYIGIDLGTSAVKLLRMDEKGNIEKIVSREYPLQFPQPGWSEQSVEVWYTQTLDGLQELLADCDKKQVAGIGCGGQMHGLVLLDKDDAVIRPAILWNDGRTTEEVAYLNEVVGQEKLAELTGNIAFAGFTAPKVLWVAKHEPENFARIHKIMLPKDYLAYKLTGEFCTDVSDASGTLFFDVKNRCWSKEMLEICQIQPQQLPKVYESYEMVGNLKSQVAEVLGVATTTFVVAGAGDNAAAAVGTGTVGANACNISLGTSGTVFITSDAFRTDQHNSLHAFAHADGKYHLMGCMLSAASCNKWWMENIIETTNYAENQEYISNYGKNHVFFLPYLMGERCPHNNPDARGTFIGMSLNTTRADMTQAVFEGVVYGLRDSVEVARNLGIELQSTRICGGGAKSSLWKKLVANILNMDVEVLEIEEGPGYGGAILAAVANGEFENVAEAGKQLGKVKTTIHPDPELAACYNAQYEKYRSLYPIVKEVYPIIKEK